MSSKKASQPPKPGASPDEWQPYALEFDGYEYAGGGDELRALYGEARARILAGEPVSGTTEYLRTVLFAHQRRYRWMMQGAPDVGGVEQHVADAILAALQRTA
jgi:hypothetical protein